ncbi:MAG: nitroreductase family protein [candidate division WOR-3 bacterium]
MDVKTAIETRRAFRSLEPVEITDDLVEDLASAASLAPSCFNNQPWRFVFVRDPEVLKVLHGTLSRGNEWAQRASMIIAAFSKKELDCDLHGREYYLFGVGMASAFLILRATELGLVAHPIAGYREDQVKDVLGIPNDMTVITLIMVGKHSPEISPLLSEKQAEDEGRRPPRKPLSEIAFMDRWPG